jgi:predicted esterase
MSFLPWASLFTGGLRDTERLTSRRSIQHFGVALASLLIKVLATHALIDRNGIEVNIVSCSGFSPGASIATDVCLLHVVVLSVCL